MCMCVQFVTRLRKARACAGRREWKTLEAVNWRVVDRPTISYDNARAQSRADVVATTDHFFPLDAARLWKSLLVRRRLRNFIGDAWKSASAPVPLKAIGCIRGEWRRGGIRGICKVGVGKTP